MLSPWISEEVVALSEVWCFGWVGLAVIGAI